MIEIMDLPDKIIIHTDGASRGNPGPAAAGFVLSDPDGNQLQGRAYFLGYSTNNIAEYTALIRALEAAKEIDVRKLMIYSDSELLVRQINGAYKVKSDQIRPLFQRVVEQLAEFEDFQVISISRDKNKEADKLVNQALNLERDVTVTSEAGLVSQVSSEQRATSDERRAKPIRLGVLISGGGRTLMNILEHISKGRLNAEIAVVISSLSTVAGVEKAKDAGLNVKIIRKKDYSDINRFSKHIEEELVAANAELVVQGGWMCLWAIPQRYENRVMNIHPALLPSFSGQGMWGHHVHDAVLAAGCKVSGCTVHFCTNEYDKGPIVVQRVCEVKEDDTPDTLAARVFQQECIAYPQAIKLFAEGRLLVQNNKVKIICCNPT